MKRLLLITLLLLISACSILPQETGVLAGNVTIGPLVPVVREGVPEPTPAPEVFASRKVVVFSQSGRREIVRASIGPDGTYQVVLPVGLYLIDIAGSEIDRGTDLPMEIEIFADQITLLDIDIDTGIR